ncbi:glycerate kinase [Paenibacillus protaetiae]|uniref:Glycerate kinase n=1 Tax=Paenibacillus protaetiae TaxID=2509456 RepID=A0A4P6EWR5_9BACL|nr:glycerate kinase [Paenibacillus protaetiae]QAY67442.1 glycerate kinase [Paenibacillus protaetiae]
MKIVIAPDKFKGSLTADEAAAAIERGVRRAVPDADTIRIPVADGGEGTLDSLVAAAGGSKTPVAVTGPLGEPVTAEYGVIGGGRTAVIEMALASGLLLVPAEQRDPLRATTYGTGELIRHALDAGCREFIIALGGSATNDGGAGMLQALGMKLLGAEGQSVPPGGGQLGRIAKIDAAQWDKRIAESAFTIAADVQNPFIGAEGATRVFGPQKGAGPAVIEQLEQAMSSWADRIAEATGMRLHDKPGAGAAGGLSGAFLAFFPARMRRGIDVVMEQAGVSRLLQGADLVLTGEGRIDGQTAGGKAPLGIAQEAKRQGVPAIALAGAVGDGVAALHAHGLCSVHSIASSPMPAEEAMASAAQLLEQAAEQIMRAFACGRR